MPRMLPAQLREARIKTATGKLLKVLRWQVVCHQKELERRVCEVGFRFYPRAPQEERPEPVHMNEARKRLAKRGIIDSWQRTVRGNTYNFWFLADTEPDVVAAHLKLKLAATDQFDLIHHDPHLSGYPTERMHWNAVGQAKDWFRMPYVEGQDIRRVNGHESDHGVDLAALHMPTQTRVVASVKNTREWYYPNSATIWQLIGSAAQLDAVPVLLAPRIAEPTFLFMEDIGGFAVPAFNTYVHRDAQGRSDWAAFTGALETLGYKDVKTMVPESPEPRYLTPWATTLPPRLEGMRTLFRGLHPEVLRLAIEEGLNDRDVRKTLVSGEPRDDAFNDFWKTLRSGPEEPVHPDVF